MNRIIVQTAENRLLSYIKEWGIEADAISIERKPSSYFHKITFRVKTDAVFFNVFLHIKIDTQSASVLDGTIDWEVLIHFHHKQTKGISLNIRPEGFLDKVFKIYGFKDKELFSAKFDRLFWVESNHEYVHAELLNELIQAKMVSLKGNYFERLLVNNTTTRVKLSYNPLEKIKFKHDFISMLEVAYNLCVELDKSSTIR